MKTKHLVLIFLLICFGTLLAFGKFLVLDQLAVIDELQATYEGKEQELQTARNANADYEEIKENYLRYTSGYYTEDEATLTDRGTVLDVMEEELADVSGVTEINVDGNVITVNFAADATTDIQELESRLSDMEAVESVSYASSNMEEGVSSENSDMDDDSSLNESDTEEGSSLTITLVAAERSEN